MYVLEPDTTKVRRNYQCCSLRQMAGLGETVVTTDDQIGTDSSQALVWCLQSKYTEAFDCTHQYTAGGANLMTLVTCGVTPILTAAGAMGAVLSPLGRQ